ncbi:MAG: HlyD family efflux transporter periplasmic adaptor subunit [Planctomycetota bacterium]|jgi:multidrug efflux pump subunit AcrA (membrane-fusion protein)
MVRERLIRNVLAVGAIACAILLGVTPAPPALADHHEKGEQAPKETRAAKPDAKTTPGQWHTVKSEPLKVQTTLSGVVEAEKSWPIKIATKQWSTLKVIEAVPQGKRVEKGQALIRFDHELINEAIHDAELAFQSTQLSLQRTTIELKSLETTTPMDLTAAEMKHRRAEEDMERYLKVDRPYNLKSNDQSLENSEYSLMSVKEELNQLRKMYEEDDLTEETEEIILKRQLHSVKRAELSYEYAKNRHENTLNTSYPRQLEDRKLGMKRSSLELERARHSIPVTLQLKQVDHGRQVVAVEKAKRKLEQLRRDKEILTVRAPADGIVYYGSFVDGKWSGAAQTQALLRPDGVVKPNTVVLTVVQPRPACLRANVSEADLAKVAKGMDAVAVPTAFPNDAYPASVRSVAPLPLNPGQYPVIAELDLPNNSRVLPGMNAKLTVTAQDLPGAITVPVGAVHRDTPDKPYVNVLGANNKVVKRNVQLGAQVGAKVHVRRGLKAGDKVRLPAPKTPAKK